MNMNNHYQESHLDLILLGGFAVFSAIGFAIASYPAIAQSQTFPDVSNDYWASPFIYKLADKGIITGYPDGTFRPEQTIDRDEFAAIIRQAFEQEKIRNIDGGNAFQDVPQGYWAANSIEEAYEAGFMQAFPQNQFRPKAELSKLEALIALTKGLNLTYQPTSQTTQANNQNQKRIKNQKTFAFPLASTLLMQPFYQKVTQETSLVNKTQTNNPNINPPQTAASPTAQKLVQNYYQDANQIPQSAVANIAAATTANIIVNYPQQKLLQPNQPLSRAGAAALIHQSLVYRGELQPLEQTAKASNYIVD